MPMRKLKNYKPTRFMVSAEDAATYDKMEKEVTDLTKDIERLQRQEQIDKMMSAPTSTPLTGKPGVKDEPEDKPGRASAAYKKAFWDNIRHPGNPAIRDVLEEGTDANGGYLVPIEFEHTLVQALNENNIMADRIKGITVEIGGDTTGLSKALSGVNKEIKSTQSQLKDVNKLLKLDPTNTTLLEQKQKLLQQAVSETKEKLTQLKSVQDQMDAGLKNGTVTQQQYDACNFFVKFKHPRNIFNILFF